MTDAQEDLIHSIDAVDLGSASRLVEFCEEIEAIQDVRLAGELSEPRGLYVAWVMQCRPSPYGSMSSLGACAKPVPSETGVTNTGFSHAARSSLPSGVPRRR